MCDTVLRAAPVESDPAVDVRTGGLDEAVEVVPPALEQENLLDHEGQADVVGRERRQGLLYLAPLHAWTPVWAGCAYLSLPAPASIGPRSAADRKENVL